MEAYPLYWPEGWKRSERAIRSLFKTGYGASRNFVKAEIARMGGKSNIISTNIPLRQDGEPLANRREPADKGVAVFFHREGKDMVFACDKFDRIQDNIYAIGKTIEALRGIERWGASDMMERAFSGFKQLTAGENWWDVLGLAADASPSDIEAAYRTLAKQAHPDRGGSMDQMTRLNVARDQAHKLNT